MFNRRQLPDRSDRERGSVIAVVAIVVTVATFAASFSVDIGRLMVRRSEAQSAADLAALGAALRLPEGYAATSQAAADLVKANLASSMPEAPWLAMWALGSCTDGSRLAIRGTLGGAPTDCISFDGRGGMRVRVPDQVLGTFFARVLGINEMRTAAAAQVRIGPDGQAPVLPFVALSGSADGSVFCLRSAATGQASPPCQGSASGNFGPLSVPQHGNAAFGTDVVPCGPDKATELAVNLSTGLDHVVLPFNGTELVDSCARPYAPNSLELFQGIGNGLWAGLVAGVTVNGRTFDGRLRTASGPTATIRHSGTDRQVDNRPLWDYLSPGKAGHVPNDCLRESYPSAFGPGAAGSDTRMASCLAAYAAEPAGSLPPLFDADHDGDGQPDLLTARRFSFIPESSAATFPSGNSGVVRIARFRPVFINALQFDCSGGGACTTVYVPGEATGIVANVSGASPLDQVSGYLIPDGALPSGAAPTGVGGSLGVFRPQLVR